METVAGKAERFYNALLIIIIIIDVQVGLVNLIPAEIWAGVISRIETLYPEPALPGHP